MPCCGDAVSAHLTWQEARLVGERNRYSWQWWELVTRAEQTGKISIRARAVDQAGRTQPDKPEWNRLGYGSNPVQEVTITVREPVALKI